MLTQAELKEIVHYDPDTGLFTWAKGRKKAALGTPAGRPRKPDGRMMVGVLGSKYLGSRLAWLYMTGQWPEKLVDHRDRDLTNDRWINLRLATHSENSHNASLRPDNTSGVKGVWYAKSVKLWVAEIAYQGKSKKLGYFKTKELAVEFMGLAREMIHGEFACHGA